MTVAKFWNGASWQTITAIQGPPGPAGPVGPGGLLVVQSIFGAAGSYSADIQGNVSNNVSIDGSTLMRLQYTPAVNCWWEVYMHMGLVQKKDAAYNYAYGQVLLTPADADGISAFSDVDTQHSTVQTFTSRSLTCLFKLNANTAYTAQAAFGGGNGGTFSYYRDAGRLHMIGKAWAR